MNWGGGNPSWLCWKSYIWWRATNLSVNIYDVWQHFVWIMTLQKVNVRLLLTQFKWLFFCNGYDQQIFIGIIWNVYQNTSILLKNQNECGPFTTCFYFSFQPDFDFVFLNYKNIVIMLRYFICLIKSVNKLYSDIIRVIITIGMCFNVAQNTQVLGLQF